MGQFIDFYLPFIDAAGNRVADSEQAQQILTKATALIAAGAKGVAITYSANYDQTVEIGKTYGAGDWNTHTSGSNQASVMMNMEILMGSTESALAHTMRIAPITTMTYNTIGNGYGGHTHKEVVEQDLKNIKSLLDDGWAVLGWINQKSKPNYGVGGGVTKSLPTELKDLIQTTLKQYSKSYLAKS